LLVFMLACVAVSFAEQHYPARGLILALDPSKKSVVISCSTIPGYMEAMTMSFSVLDAKQLEGLKPGTMIDFTLTVQKDSAYVEAIRVHSYQGLEPDPLAARRLKLLNRVVNASTTKPLVPGDAVPDFILTGQDGAPVTFSKFKGKVVALNFIYTRCALPNFCFRSSNNFGVLQKRFRNRLGRNLVLLTVTFDPEHDRPEVLAKYAQIWKADPRAWYFLTGSAADVRRVCDLFGEDFFQDEGLMDHSLHTAVINRHGKLVANLEGNEFSANQLGDLLQTVLSSRQ